MKLASALPEQPGLQRSLYTSPGSLLKKEIVHTKHFQFPSCTISLRPFCIISDMPVVFNWAWKINYAADLIAASYLYTRESNFARSYMVLLNDTLPVCEIDICRATQDELCDHFKAVNGDCILRLLMSGKKKSGLFQLQILQTCLEYFFRFPEVERIIVEPEAGNNEFNQLLTKAGFRFQQKIYQLYKTSNLYYCTRQTIRK